jgi:DNA-binding NarL/FixJ family response regulator
VSDRQIHAIVHDGWRGKGKDIPYWRCQVCGKRFSGRCNTPLYYLKTPDASGTDLLKQLREEHTDATMIISTVVDDEGQIQRSFAAGANYYVVKPNGLRKLLADRNSPDLLLDPVGQQLLRGR